MGNADFMLGRLEPYGPKLPITDLVVEVNKLYHAFEARDYDESHPEIFEHLPTIWRDMVRVAMEARPDGEWSILDFGCGTGFEADQLLRLIPRDRLRKLTCYDPSPEMLEKCRAKIAPQFPGARFIGRLEELVEEDGSYTLLSTNSVLHHLPDAVGVIEQLTRYLTPDAVWLAGHEPSNRYYRNRECVETINRYRREQRWLRFLQPEKYVNRLKRALGMEQNPAVYAASQAQAKGLFTRTPPADLISLLVDFHVAHTAEEAISGRGFDFEVLKGTFGANWEQRWVTTYFFMGPYSEGKLAKRWIEAGNALEKRFPNDGSVFASVWNRR